MSEPVAEPLKLIALDADDLSVISAHLQDAVLKRGDIVWLPAEKRFALALRRFDWEGATQGQKRRLALLALVAAVLLAMFLIQDTNKP